MVQLQIPVNDFFWGCVFWKLPTGVEEVFCRPRMTFRGTTDTKTANNNNKDKNIFLESASQKLLFCT